MFLKTNTICHRKRKAFHLIYVLIFGQLTPIVGHFMTMFSPDTVCLIFYIL